MNLKLYTKTVCPKCLWVKSELVAKGIDVEVVNIDHEENARTFLQQQGVLAVPVLQTADELLVTTASILGFVEQQ